jgi:hypothetical protein
MFPITQSRPKSCLQASPNSAKKSDLPRWKSSSPRARCDWATVGLGHYDHGPELEAFCKVHAANQDVAARRFDMFIQNLECHPDLSMG